LLIWGESDKLIPPVYAQAFQENIPGADLVMIPQAGHLVAFEKPAEVVGALSRLQ
jgi:pimeloyl-ACP methyl ester carboxylesterase